MIATLANPASMIEQGAPRLIHNDADLDCYTRELFKLTAKDDPTEAEIEAIDLLSVLIERYERERYPIPAASPDEVLRFLMERHELRQRDLVPQLGSEANVSLLLSGKRNLTISHIQALVTRFNVSPSVFFPVTR